MVLAFPRRRHGCFGQRPDLHLARPQVNRLSNSELTFLRKSTSLIHQPEASALSPVRIGIDAASRHHPSFVQLYYAIEARRTSAMPLVVQFISPTPGTGASTVASGYARVAADNSTRPVLYIDC